MRTPPPILPIILALGASIAPLAAEAQPAGKVPHIAIVSGAIPVAQMLGPDPAPWYRAFVQGLRALGYADGRNIVIERRSAEGKLDRLPEIFAELLQAKVDVIVVATVPVVQAARRATSTTPIVMAAGGDPVALGLAESLARPGGNVTGVSDSHGWQVLGKLLEILKEEEAVPTVSRVAVLSNEAPLGAASNVLGAAADALRLTLLPLAVDGQEQLAPAFATFTRQRADGLFVRATGFTFVHRRLIADLATRHRLPSISAFRDAAEAGGLLAYGPSLPDQYRRAAGYVDKILKGAKPADLPIEQATKFELIVNLKTAKALGLRIPPSVQSRADEIIK
jgi:putative ABC transport system substrate-binding protein